jgi:hypothetical protein
MTKPAVILFLLLMSLTTFGQPAGQLVLISSSGVENLNSKALPALQKKYLDKIYFSSVTAPNELINGKEYVPYFFRSGTNPLLYANINRSSTLFFRDMMFKNLSLQYDTYRDEVIYSDKARMVSGRYPQIALNRDNIKGFNLYFDFDSLIFRHFSFPSKDADRMKDGFYEVVYDGKSQFLIRHRSTIYNKEGVDKYAYAPEKYILSGDAWVKISSKNSLMKIFSGHEKEMSAMLHKSKIKVPRATKGQIAEILNYYDSSYKQEK